MERQALRDWVVRYNTEGVDGLRNRVRSGRPALLAPELEEELRQLIEDGRDVERDGVIESRVKHIRDLALRLFGVDYSRSGMQGRLHRIKLSYLKPRPIHLKIDPAAQEAFKKCSPG
jgi:transposase